MHPIACSCVVLMLTACACACVRVLFIYLFIYFTHARARQTDIPAAQAPFLAKIRAVKRATEETPLKISFFGNRSSSSSCFLASVVTHVWSSPLLCLPFPSSPSPAGNGRFGAPDIGPKRETPEEKKIRYVLFIVW